MQARAPRSVVPSHGTAGPHVFTGEAVLGVAGLPATVCQVPAPSGPQPFWQQETLLRVFFVFGHLSQFAGS